MKKLLQIVAVVAMGLAITACSDKKKASDNSDDKSDKEKTEKTDKAMSDEEVEEVSVESTGDEYIDQILAVVAQTQRLVDAAETTEEVNAIIASFEGTIDEIGEPAPGYQPSPENAQKMGLAMSQLLQSAMQKGYQPE